MSGIDAGVVGDWLADADDAPIPLPWRGEVYHAPPPDGARGKRIAAYLALNRAGDEADEAAMEEVLQGEPLGVLALGRETYDALTAAGMKGDAMRRAQTLCIIRWGYGSDDVARLYLESVTKPAEPEPETPKAPKSKAASRPRTSRPTASARKTPRAGTRTTSSPKE